MRLDAVCERLLSRASLPQQKDAQTAFFVVIESLLARLTSGEGHRLIHALPRSLRAPLGHLLQERGGHVIDTSNRSEMVARVADELALTPAHAELVCETVFECMRENLPAAVVAAVTHQLPRDVRALWLASSPPVWRAPALENGRPAVRALEAELARRVRPPPGLTAAMMFAAVLGTLLRRLSGGEARHLFLGLPQALRPLVTASMLERREAPVVIDRDEFLQRIAERLGVSRVQAEIITREVLALVRDAIPELEVNGVASQLPRSMAGLWPGSSVPIRKA